jgi:hypothetical protein
MHLCSPFVYLQKLLAKEAKEKQRLEKLAAAIILLFCYSCVC